MFWTNWKREENDVSAIESRLIKAESRIAKLESDLMGVVVSVDTIRNKVLRKIQFKKEEEEEESDRYKGMLVPERP